MKRKFKIALGGLTLLAGAVILSGCTASFCTVTDQAHMLYAHDYGITDYRNENGDTQAVAYLGGLESGKIVLTNVKYKSFSTVDSEAREQIYEYCSTFKSIDESAAKDNITLPTVKFLTTLDAVVLGHAIDAAVADNMFEGDPATWTTDQIVRDYKNTESKKGVLDVYGYLKFEDTQNDSKSLWTNFEVYVDEVKAIIGIDECPSSDYLKLYKNTLTGYVSGQRSCLAIDTGDYGAYGPRGTAVEIEGKKWTDWKGLLEFLLVWPIGALIDVLTKNFLASGIFNGWAQLLSILVVTFLVRGLMLTFTIKQSANTAKMNELQPELQKIQAKYPNANNNQSDKQRLAAETQKLYKKHKINPLSSILVMFIQFPIFICVWGAMQGSAYLSSGQFLGLRFSDSISSALFNASNWATGTAETALFLFLIMSAAQAVAMLLPQWIQKAKSKDAAKLGKNPTQQQNTNRMKIFTYVMLAMIIFMGFSLASGMGIYWLFGAIFSIVQTLVMQAVTARKAKKQKYGNNYTGKKKGK